MRRRRTIDLRTLPKLRDGLSYLFVEHGRIEREDSSIAWFGLDGAVAIPAAALAVLLLGPGVTVTHAAMVALADNGVTVAWVGEQGVRFYASATGETRSARNVERQAMAWAYEDKKMQVVRRLYGFRFAEPLDEALTLQQIRGKEGVRVREGYSKAAKAAGITWRGRNYKRDDWSGGDPVNRALSAGNACLYGLCHAAIVSLGFSPALGFLHSGKQLSFVYDVADLYKSEVVVPIAFAAAGASDEDVERRVRLTLRDRFRETRLLERIAKDLHRLFDLDESEPDEYEIDAAKPGDIWDGDKYVAGGVEYGRDDA
jgi:CRISPR-associated protein Cas1